MLYSGLTDVKTTIEPLEVVKCRYVIQALQYCKFNASQAAKLLKIERKSVYLILKRNGYTLHKKNLHDVKRYQTGA